MRQALRRAKANQPLGCLVETEPTIHLRFRCRLESQIGTTLCRFELHLLCERHLTHDARPIEPEKNLSHNDKLAPLCEEIQFWI